MNFFRSISTKILVPVVIVILLVGTIIVAVSTRNFTKFADEVFDHEIEVYTRGLEQNILMLQVIATDQVNSLARNVDMIEAIREGCREAKIEVVTQQKMRDIISKFESKRKCAFFTILDAEGNVLLRSAEPERPVGDSLASLRGYREAVRTKTYNVYFETTRSIPMSIRAAVPVLDDDGTIIAVITGGFRFDTNDWVDDMKRLNDIECTVFAGDERVATTIMTPGTNERLTGTILDNPEIRETVFNKKEPYHGDAVIATRAMKTAYIPIINEDENEVLGMFFIGIPIDQQNALVRENLLFILAITGVALLISLGVLIWIIGAIVAPIRKITKAATELADGQLEVDVEVKTKDETAILGKAFHRLAESLRSKTDVALAIAKGDLTVWVPLSSDDDRLGKCLVRMRYSLYDSIKGLKGLAESISTEATSLAQVNQTLVENSTNSAEQLKEISGSIRSLHTQTEQNAASARNAENLTKSAMDGSNDGREKMGRMVHAMEAITKSAGEIKNIIRVIDDIAFQTNLLALNAAVEAARAGQHGKGFAVVAEEVRNLASRSAKAASETAALIEESIRQVGQGSNVAHETSDSLNVITDQVEQISKIVTTISEESDHQAKHLGTMTGTVGQVSTSADATMHSVSNVSSVIASVNNTVSELEDIVKHFKSNPGGVVMVPGQTYPGHVPGHGAFRNL